MYRLIFLNGKHRGRRLAIQQGDLVLGSDQSCHVTLLDDPDVASVHATILARDDEYILQDEAGGEKTLVNRHPIKVHRLHHGDQLQFGATQIEFQRMEAPAVSTPARRVSVMQVMALIGVVVVLLLQALFVFGLPVLTAAIGTESPDPASVTEVAEAVVTEPAPAEPEPEPEPAPEVAPEPELNDEARFESMMLTATEEIGRLRFAQADELYESITAEDPDFLPALVARAKLFERRGMNNRALEQWKRVLDRSWGTPVYDEALNAQRQLLFAELDSFETPTSSPSPGRLGKRIVIDEINRERFPESADHDEMRSLRINLRPAASETSISVTDVRVVVEFFERVQGTDEVVVSTSNQSTNQLNVAGAWVPGEVKSVNATYIIPRGAREQERLASGERRGYEGYRVLLYYRGDLQDEDASPRRLLDLPRQPAPR